MTRISDASMRLAESRVAHQSPPCLHDVRSTHRSFSSRRPLVSQSSWLSSLTCSDQPPSESHSMALPWRPWRAHRLRSPSEERASPRRIRGLTDIWLASVVSYDSCKTRRQSRVCHTYLLGHNQPHHDSTALHTEAQIKSACRRRSERHGQACSTSCHMSLYQGCAAGFRVHARS